jgi:hypothetical protein
MKRIIRLTESDLTRLVRRVIKEREMDDDRPLNSKKFVFDDISLLLKEASSQVVQNYLSQLPDTIRFISIVNCESADFSEVDICGFEDLLVVNLMNTPNNFVDMVDCEYESISDFMFTFDMEDDDDDEVSFRDDDEDKF